MATPLFTNRTTDGVSAGVSLVGPASIVIHKDSVFEGAEIIYEIADTDTDADYGPPDDEARFHGPGAKTVFMQGSYFLRLRQLNSTPGTSITGVVSQ